jgi:hypothetical protein
MSSFNKEHPTNPIPRPSSRLCDSPRQAVVPRQVTWRDRGAHRINTVLCLFSLFAPNPIRLVAYLAVRPLSDCAPKIFVRRRAATDPNPMLFSEVSS